MCILFSRFAVRFASHLPTATLKSKNEPPLHKKFQIIFSKKGPPAKMPRASYCVIPERKKRPTNWFVHRSLSVSYCFWLSLIVICRFPVPLSEKKWRRLENNLENLQQSFSINRNTGTYGELLSPTASLSGLLKRHYYALPTIPGKP